MLRNSWEGQQKSKVDCSSEMESSIDRLPDEEAGHLSSGSARQPGTTLAETHRRRYQQKNNNGYLLNAFLDFETPLDILTHLLIGSEGTLGFIAEAVLHTLPDYPRRYTGQLYSRPCKMRPMRSARWRIGSRAAEIMDRPSLARSSPARSACAASAAAKTAAAILVDIRGRRGTTSPSSAGPRRASCRA